MEDLPPPPPYTPHDPAAISLRQSRDSDLAVETPISIFSSSVQEEGYVSGVPYFAIRPATQPRPSNTIQYQFLTLPNSSPENIKFPGPEFVRRNVNRHDWSTFLNHMFPLHSVVRNGDGYTSEKKSHDAKSALGLPRKSSQPESVTEASRRRRIRPILSEWNMYFFAPRGIRIIADVKPAQSSSAAVSNPIDAKPFGGETALYKAISANDLNAVQVLLSRGANPDAKAYGGEPAIYRTVRKLCDIYAASNDAESRAAAGIDTYKQILNLLLAYGADVDANPPGIGTPLHAAANGCHSEIVELLLRYGADTNAKPLWGETPLYAAVKAGNEAISKTLIAAGADTDDSPPGNESALNVAVTKGYRAIAEMLLEVGAGVEEKHWTGGSPVMAAAHKGDVDILRKLLEKGAKVDAMPAGMPTAMGEATSRGDIAVVKVCLEFGADPTKQKWALESPLAVAVGKGDQELLNLMLNAIGGAGDIRAQARKLAAEKGQLDLLSIPDDVSS